MYSKQIGQGNFLRFRRKNYSILKAIEQRRWRHYFRNKWYGINSVPSIFHWLNKSIQKSWQSTYQWTIYFYNDVTRQIMASWINCILLFKGFTIPCFETSHVIRVGVFMLLCGCVAVVDVNGRTATCATTHGTRLLWINIISWKYVHVNIVYS